jgi:ATP-dependent RNA helicase HelY
MIERGGFAGRAAVLSIGQRKGGITRVRAITPKRQLVTLSAGEFERPPRPLAKLELPVPFSPNRQIFQREVARELERARLHPVAPERPERLAPDPLATHPVADDPDLRERLRAATQADRAEREVDDLQTRVRGRSESLARRFDRVLRILDQWEYLDGWELTEAGQSLARLFHECDLLVTEALRQGLLDDLDAPAFAALLSVFTYEHRSPEAPPAPWFPSPTARKRWLAIEKLARQLNEVEEEAGLPVTRAPDPTFAAVAFAWAAGETFADVVEEEELSGGDFVRNMKQLIDLLRQLALLAPKPATRAVAAEAADRLFRGVVAASTAIDGDDP